MTDSKMIDLLLSGSEWGYNNLKTSFFYKNGEIAKYGCPRNDIFFTHSKDYLYKEVRKKYEISEDKKICLFAPTFRKSFKIGESFVTDELWTEKITDALNERFGGEWVIFLKYHPASIAKFRSIKNFKSKNVINVSNYSDIADLLIASDALISDYSSVSFDYALTKKPCWLYFKNFEEYSKKECNVIIDIEKLSFKVCRDEQELIKKIKSFDTKNYSEETDKMLEIFGSYEKGHACEKVAERILSVTE